MNLFVKLVVVALLSKCGQCENQEDEAETKDEQLLKFQIPLGWGAGQLLEEDDPALK